MRALNLLQQSEGSLLADFASRMSEQMIRQRANLEVRAARAEAENAIKARSEFLANMNHELRTPLNAIIGFATMLRDNDEYDVPAETRGEYAEYILQSADLLLGHINTILEVAALESGGIDIAHEDVDLNELLTAAAERAAIRAHAANVTIVRRDDDGPVLATGDPIRAGQAIDHLIQTAINACDEGGRVLIRASYNDEAQPEVAIRDEGAGMTDDEVKTALDAFSEMHRGLDRAFSGPGVGYAIAKTFIELQGGGFFMKSRTGRGTLVRLVFPDPETDPFAADDDVEPMEESHAA